MESDLQPSTQAPFGVGAIVSAAHARHAANRAGALADYIPELAAVDPERFGIALATVGRSMAGWPSLGFGSMASMSFPPSFFSCLQRPATFFFKWSYILAIPTVATSYPKEPFHNTNVGCFFGCHAFFSGP